MIQLQFPQTESQQMLNILTNIVPVCSIYVFGYNNYRVATQDLVVNNKALIAHHFYLLMVTSVNSKKEASNLSNRVSETSNKTITASILLHKTADLATKQQNQVRFFDNILRNSHRLCIDKVSPPYLVSNTIPQRNIEDDRTFWLKCIAVAQFNIQAAADSPHVEVELCKVALLNSACTQICLGLIRVFMEYTSKVYGLNYLLTLCTHFTNLPAQIFSQNTPQSTKRYKMLCAPPTMLNHWTKIHAAESDFLWLLDAIQQFVELSEEIVNKKLESYH